MSVSRYKLILDKSISAAISAIEIYNKPDFKYREENFSILMINAWELLLKAKIIKDNHGQLNSIYINSKPKTKDWKESKRFFPKLNRTWNPITLSIQDCFLKIDINKILIENINLLIEIRDNSIHYINNDKSLNKKILEIWTSSLKSYVQLCENWFDYDLSQYNFFLMPISFFHTFEAESFSLSKKNKQIELLKKYINRKEEDNPSDITKEHNISLILETTFKKSKKWLEWDYDEKSIIWVKIDSEDEFKRKYPLSFMDLRNKLKNKHKGFKQNKEFRSFLKKLKEKEEFYKERFLDYDNQSSSKKGYYSNNIFKEFKKFYGK